MQRVGDRRGREFLSDAGGITGGRGEKLIQPSCINYPDPLRSALLICNKLAKTFIAERIERQAVKPDPAPQGSVEKCIRFDAGIVVDHPLNAELEPAAFIHLRFAV